VTTDVNDTKPAGAGVEQRSQQETRRHVARVAGFVALLAGLAVTGLATSFDLGPTMTTFGITLLAAAAAALTPARAWRLAWRGRRMVRPVLVLIAVQLAGVAVAALPMPVLWAAGAAVAAAVVCLARVRDGHGGKAPVAAAAAWLLLAATFGPFGWTAAALWTVGVAAAVPHWVRHKAPFREQPPQMDAPEPEPGPRLAGQQQTWQDRVGNPAAGGQPAGALLGSRLLHPQQVDGGWTARVEGVPGVHDFDRIRQAHLKIASAFEVNRAQVQLEPADDGAEHAAQITVITKRDNLRRVHILEEDGARIDVETGLGRVGYFVDRKPAHWSFWTPSGGAQFGLVAGASGSGKSRAVETLIAMEHACPSIVPILIDAQDGQSMPCWNGRTWRNAVGVPDAMAELECLDWVMRARAHMIARIPWVDDQGRERVGYEFLLPHPGMPQLAINLDEAPLLLLDEVYGARAVQLLSTGAKTWRKAGGSLKLITQVPSLEELKSQTLRGMLRGGGNVVSFRTGESVSHGMLGLANDPSKLPEFFPNTDEKTHGVGYIVGPDQRQVTYRHLLTRDPYGIATQPRAGKVDDTTLELFDRYAAQLKQAKVTKEVAPAAAPTAAPRATSGDVAAAVERVISQAAGPVDLGSLYQQAARHAAGATVGDVKAALKQLETGGRVYRTGDTWQPAPVS
jgi:hypothetical protein